MFWFLFLPHLAVLSPLAAGARRVFGRVEHCFASHCQGACLSPKCIRLMYKGGGYTYKHANEIDLHVSENFGRLTLITFRLILHLTIAINPN